MGGSVDPDTAEHTPGLFESAWPQDPQPSGDRPRFFAHPQSLLRPTQQWDPLLRGVEQ